MNIVHALHDLQPCNRSVAVAIGFFDGVHIGHQQILGTTVTAARDQSGIPVAITFDRHPSCTVAPERVPPLIQSMEARVRGIAEAGIETLVLLKFDVGLREISAGEFVRNVANGARKLTTICVGDRFQFGKDRQGDVALLNHLATEMGYRLNALPPVTMDGLPVSSTRIRSTIAAGDIECASRMLGRAYSIWGKVVPGDRLGRKLGFPTANVDCSELVLPPFGVYLANARTSKGTAWSVVNIGTRPTVAAIAERRVEAYLLDFEGDLYGEEIELVLDKQLRAEMRFPNVDALKKQIAKDVENAREALAGVARVSHSIQPHE